MTTRSTPELTVAIATDDDRSTIYRLRHTVYATELGQHAENADLRLVDALDDENTYLVVRRHEEIVGYVSITSPGPRGYSLEKYLPLHALPFAVDEHTFEVRLLTVRRDQRGGGIALVLMLGALRWIQARGGTRVVALGRREVLPMYRKAGLTPLDIVVSSGAVSYAVMTATIDDLRKRAGEIAPSIRRASRAVAWEGGPLV